MLIKKFIFALLISASMVTDFWMDTDDIGIVPLTDAAGITQGFKPGEHYGIDIGWHDQHGCNVLAWQDGKVVDSGYYGDTGYWVALEHYYSDGTKRWTVYIHLAGPSCMSNGGLVYMGEPIGFRGNTGRSSGEHLHFYLTEKVDIDLKFNFTNLKKHAVDPVPYLYYSKRFNIIYISTKWWTKELPDDAIDFMEDYYQNDLLYIIQ